MKASKLTRRALLGAGLGLGQLALIDRFCGKSARAGTADAPSRILTIYLQGGYVPQYIWCPLTADEVATHIPAPYKASENVFFLPEQVIELSTAGDGKYPRIRGVQTWDPQSPGDRGANRDYLPLGYSWVAHDLMKHTTVVHGIDQGTAAHASGAIASMCGVAGADYRAPAVQSVIANHLIGVYGDDRPLPCVTLDTGLMPNPFDLPAAAGPTVVGSAKDLVPALSTDPAQNAWWKGLDARTPKDELAFDGTPLPSPLGATDLEAHTFGSFRARRGVAGASTDAYLERFHDGLQNVSRVLAKDVVTTLTNATGFEYMTPETDREYGGVVSYPGAGPFGYTVGYADGNVSNSTFWNTFDMALRVMKTDLASAVHMTLPLYYYDSHAGIEGHQGNFIRMRGSFEILGQFLHEMAQSPAPGKPGKTLLDDTLVVIFSEFARTWPKSGDDHWPITSVTFVGGNVAENREIGAYDFTNFSFGPRGSEVDVVEEGGEAASRVPRAADVVTTACRVMGLEAGTDFFIPGGYGEIVGVRKDG
jgi:hypothetical protein